MIFGLYLIDLEKKTKILNLKYIVFILYIYCFFPNYWDLNFYFIINYFLEIIINIILDFYFIKMGGDILLDDNIINMVKY
jgi:hypothetical protein